MRRFAIRLGSAALAVPFATLLVVAGCGDAPPPVSSSSTEVTVHGTVKYKGQPVTEGTIQFDPANIQRKEAKAATAPIGKDGTYTLKTLIGENRITFDVPSISRKDASAAAFMELYDAPSGDSTHDVEIKSNQ